MFYTGGDDCLVYVWDRRVLAGGKPAPVGVFVGHQEGITHIDSKGDTRCLASSGEDQLIKLWDLRRMQKVSELRHVAALRRVWGFDYRLMDYPLRGQQVRHPADRSTLDLRSHYVLGTLIRCRFSPCRRYIYTGSADGCVYVFDTLKGATGEKPTRVLSADVEETGEMTPQEQIYTLPARDVAWHPDFPLLVATSFSGNLNVWKYEGEETGEAEKSERSSRRFIRLMKSVEGRR